MVSYTIAIMTIRKFSWSSSSEANKQVKNIKRPQAEPEWRLVC